MPNQTNRKMTKEKFFKRNEKLVNRFVRGFLAKNKVGVVHGTRATNAQLPRFLKKDTRDWDVFVKKPKVRANQVERLLDKRFRGDFFVVKKGKGSPGVNVFKVNSTVTGENFVDLANFNRKVPSVSKRGVRFATLKDQVKVARKNVKNPELKFRREKDLSLIKRVRKFEKIRRKKI